MYAQFPFLSLWTSPKGEEGSFLQALIALHHKFRCLEVSIRGEILKVTLSCPKKLVLFLLVPDPV